MKTGLLESLRKYRPREGNDPLENFLTEAFAWILINYSDFSEFFLNKITAKPNMQLQGMDGKNCEWTTQYNFDGVFPDMVCISNNHAIIFEHKAWSHLHEGQLQSYKNYAAGKFIESKVVLITASSYQHSQNPDLAWCWSDVYELMLTWLDNNTDASFIFNDFLRLLKSEGMGPPAPISHESILYYYATVDIKENIRNLLKRIENNDWSVNIQNDFELLIKNAWGRIGLELLNSWRPGIFVGIMMDGKDHCTTPTNTTKGPDFCLIIDFDNDLHNRYPSNNHYLEFVNKLSKKIASLQNGFDFYDHLADTKIKSNNKWHPIHIRQPLLNVLIGSSTAEEQDNIFYRTANDLIKLVTDEESFWKLRSDYNKNL